MNEADLEEVRGVLASAQATCCEGLLISALLNQKVSKDEQKKLLKRQLDVLKEMGTKTKRNVEHLCHPLIIKRSTEAILG